MVPGDVEEDNSVAPLLLKLWCEIFSVALEFDVVGQIFPLAQQQVLAAHLPVKHFIADTRVESLRMRLCK
jgi:hypothetical protein